MEEKDYYGYVYLTMDMTNDKVYIGQKKGKVEDSTDYFGSGTIIKRIIKKRGTADLKKLILEVCYSRENLLIRETFYKFKYNAFDRLYGYNIALCDSGGDTLSHHPDKELILQKLKGRILSEEEYSRRFSQEYRDRISALKKGHITTEETRVKIGDSNRGKIRSQEVKDNIKLMHVENENFGMKNKHHSEETKEKIRKDHIGKKHSPERVRKNSESHKGIKWTEERKQKAKGRIPWNKGKKFNKNTKIWENIDNEEK